MPRRRPAGADRLRGWRRRLRALLHRRNAEHELSAELAFHLDMETEKNIRAGQSPAAARRAAMLAFGGVDRFAEDVRDVRNLGWLEDLRQDLLHAVRGFRRAPGFTAAAVTAICLGVGANTAVFAVVYAVALAPLPYAEPDRLVRLWESHPAQRVDRGGFSPGTFVDLRERSRGLDGIALFGERPFLLTEGGETWESQASAVSPALFEVLGIRALREADRLDSALHDSRSVMSATPLTERHPSIGERSVSRHCSGERSKPCRFIESLEPRGPAHALGSWP
jgi:putative ABC transport system permease protein